MIGEFVVLLKLKVLSPKAILACRTNFCLTSSSKIDGLNISASLIIAAMDSVLTFPAAACRMFSLFFLKAFVVMSKGPSKNLIAA